MRLVSGNSLLSVVLENRDSGAGTAPGGGPPEPGFRVARQATDKAELWTEDDLPGWDEDGQEKVRRMMMHTLAPPAGPAALVLFVFILAADGVMCLLVALRACQGPLPREAYRGLRGPLPRTYFLPLDPGPSDGDAGQGVLPFGLHQRYVIPSESSPSCTPAPTMLPFLRDGETSD